MNKHFKKRLSPWLHSFLIFCMMKSKCAECFWPHAECAGYLDAHLWSRLLSAEPATFHGTSFLIEQTTARFSKKWTKWAWRETSDMAEIKFLELLWSPPWAWELPITQAFGFEIGGIVNEWRNVANVRTGFLPKLQPKQRVAAERIRKQIGAASEPPSQALKRLERCRTVTLFYFCLFVFGHVLKMLFTWTYKGFVSVVIKWI